MAIPGARLTVRFGAPKTERRNPHLCDAHQRSPIDAAAVRFSTCSFADPPVKGSILNADSQVPEPLGSYFVSALWTTRPCSAKSIAALTFGESCRVDG